MSAYSPGFSAGVVDCAQFHFEIPFQEQPVSFCENARLAVAKIFEVHGVKYDMAHAANQQGQLWEFYQQIDGQSGNYEVPEELAQELLEGKYEPAPTVLQCLGQAVRDLCAHISRSLVGVEVSLGSYHDLLATGDVDGDGHPDLLVDSSSGAFLLYGPLLTGGQLKPGINFTWVSSLEGGRIDPMGTTLADLDGDGLSDLISLAESTIVYSRAGERPHTLTIPPQLGIYRTTTLTGESRYKPLAQFGPDQINLGNVMGDSADDIGFLWKDGGRDAFGILQGKNGGLGDSVNLMSSDYVTGGTLGDRELTPVAIQRAGDFNGDGIQEVVWAAHRVVNDENYNFLFHLPVGIEKPDSEMTVILPNKTHNLGGIAAVNLNGDRFGDIVIELFPLPEEDGDVPISSFFIVWGNERGLPPGKLSISDLGQIATQVDGVLGVTGFFPYNETGLAVVMGGNAPAVTLLLPPRTGEWPDRIGLASSAIQLWHGLQLVTPTSPNQAGMLATGPIAVDSSGPCLVAGGNTISVIDVSSMG